MRSRTLLGRRIEELIQLRKAGLTRVHVGVESGHDAVLDFVEKGVTGAQQIDGCSRVMRAELELSCYVMPGLGGKRWTREHAHDTAHVLSAIAPHFIRLRSLAVPPGSTLDEAHRNGDFEPLTDLDMVTEIRAMIVALSDIDSYLVSDHMLNLLGELEGQLPGERRALLGMIDAFLGLDADSRELFIIGRRVGLVQRPVEIYDEGIRNRLCQTRERARQNPGGVEGALGVVRRRFI